MSDRMTTLLEDPNNCETIARCWPVIREILTEQQLIMACGSEEDPDSKKLKGFATAYRALEKFQIKGQAALDKKSKAEK